MLIQLRAVIIKEVRQILMDRRMMAMLVIAPFIQLIVFAKAVNFEVDRVPTVVVDHDQTATSREHARRLLADGTLLSAGAVTSDQEAMALLDEGDAAAAVIIPEGLDADLLRHRPSQLQVVMDGTDPNRAGVVAATVLRYFREIGDTPEVTVVPRIYYNPTLETAVYMVPGVAAMLLVIVTTLVTAMGLAREREMGTLEQVLVTPIRSSVLLGGKILPYVAIGLFDVSLALAVGAWIFGLPIRGSLLFLGLATLLYLLSTLGAGLLISTISQTQQQAFMGGFLFMIPAILLSGNMTPIASMPSWLQPITYLNPLRYYIAILRAILLKGATLSEMWAPTLALGVYGLCIFGLAVSRFRKTAA